MRKEGDKYIEMDEKATIYQYHDTVSMLYGIVLIGLFLAVWKDHGFEIVREGTEIDRHIMVLGIGWYTFDLIIKSLAGIGNSFVWAHHLFTVFSMLGGYFRNETNALGAIALFTNDVGMLFFVLKRTFERMNLDMNDDRCKLNFVFLSITFVITRWGNFWLLYTHILSFNNNPFLVVLNCPTLAFGTIISIKFLSKLWKHIPGWSSNPDKVSKMAVWKSIRVMFQHYNSRGMLTKLVNFFIYTISVFTPILMSVYLSYSGGLEVS
mmetsp:Transcript_391/g.353  ORF Transcript_391/g.353 Transcript_391/m.353 type:complete len:265 (+) Transcript_391:109-903(+)